MHGCRRSKERALGIRKMVAFVVLGLFGPGSDVRAEISNEIEPEYALAVLAYNDQDFNSALKLLSELQKKAPRAAEILELKAITLKALKNEREAAKIYNTLVQLKQNEKRDKKEIAPYAFELGVIRYNQKNWKLAERYLAYSARHGFNVEVSRFYLGLIQSQTQDWVKAEQNFKATARGGVEELHPAAHYYLAQVYFKLGYPSDGFKNLLDAKRTSNRYIDRNDVQAESKKMAEQVREAADATLAPFDRSQTFGNFSFLLGYDTNVLLVPSTDVPNTSGSGKTTPKALLSAGLGYASSPMRSIQYVPSVRFNLNKNFNGDSKAGEFADTTFSLFFTKDAIAPFSFGLKSEGSGVFQNQVDSSGSSKYSLYNTSLLFAPYTKWDATRKWTLGAEVGYRILSFSGEDTVADSLRRSGKGIIARLSAQNRTQRKRWNPTYVLKAELNPTVGTEYDSKVLGAQVINTMTLGKINFSQVLELTRTIYPDSSTDRGDTFVLLALQASKKIGPRWAVLATGDYTKNISSDEASYSYDRITLNAGLGYSF